MACCVSSVRHGWGWDFSGALSPPTAAQQKPTSPALYIYNDFYYTNIFYLFARCSSVIFSPHFPSSDGMVAKERRPSVLSALCWPDSRTVSEWKRGPRRERREAGSCEVAACAGSEAVGPWAGRERGRHGSADRQREQRLTRLLPRCAILLLSPFLPVRSSPFFRHVRSAAGAPRRPPRCWCARLPQQPAARRLRVVRPAAAAAAAAEQNENRRAQGSSRGIRGNRERQQ